MPATKATPEKRSVFEVLSEIDVNEHTEKKNGLTYLSWAWAWGELKKRYPASYYTIYHNKDDWNYFTDGHTCWVKTGITVVDGDYVQEYIEELPVMDFKNNSVPVDQVTSTQVNKTIQRSLTKAIARHGLGLYIYAGEDMPEEGADVKRQKAELAALIANVDQKIKAIIRPMTPEQKKQFAAEKVVPAIGQTNYLTCTDVDKLKTLLSISKLRNTHSRMDIYEKGITLSQNQTISFYMKKENHYGKRCNCCYSWQSGT